MTKGITTLIRKDPQQGSIPSNYRPITCLPIMWKSLSALIKEKYISHLIGANYFQKNRMDAAEKKRGSHDLLYIYQHILKEVKIRHKNIAMAWIDYRKAYDIVPHTWILECQKCTGFPTTS